ncbi:MAG: class I SAM-dependent methyltransferase [Succinivibrio sp.]|nr:class I SAM-dependent methyltransferase [Succinivibrio sp.]
MAFDNKAPQKARVNRTQGFKKGFAKTKEGAKKEFSKNKGFEKKTEKKDFLENAKRAFKARNYDKKAPRDEASFKHQDEHVEFVRRKGFSPFQLRLVNSILEDVLVMHNSLDRAYAYWFNKVKIDPVEQGFLIRQINFMFSRLSLFAFVSNLKRPSDFERHVGRLTFSYCAYKDWPLPELEGEEGFDRRGLKKRIAQANDEPLYKEGCPLWLQELGSSELKGKWDEQRQALGQESKRFIRTNTLKGTREELAHLLSEEGVVTKPVAGVPLALEVTSNSALFRTKAFKEGRFEQQDAGSQMIGAFVDAKPGQRVVDTCAGAGGKTLQLAASMAGKGVIIAMDTESWKLEDLKKRAKRAGAFNIETRLIDSTKVVKRMAGTADTVLIDAPCSGTGVIRRMPDSKWRDGREHYKELISLQQDILTRYSNIAKVGGFVIYSTCSIMPSENEKQIETFLKAHEGQFELVEDKHVLPSSGFDGFYMAKLKRLS